MCTVCHDQKTKCRTVIPLGAGGAKVPQMFLYWHSNALKSVHYLKILPHLHMFTLLHPSLIYDALKPPKKLTKLKASKLSSMSTDQRNTWFIKYTSTLHKCTLRLENTKICKSSNINKTEHLQHAELHSMTLSWETWLGRCVGPGTCAHCSTRHRLRCPGWWKPSQDLKQVSENKWEKDISRKTKFTI